MSNPTDPDDDDLPAEIDFSQGTRGQFYQPQPRLSLPVYLEAEVEAYLTARAGQGRRGRPARQRAAEEGYRADRSRPVARVRVSSPMW